MRTGALLLAFIAACGSVKKEADAGDDVDSGSGIDASSGISVTLGPADPDTTVNLTATASGFEAGTHVFVWYQNDIRRDDLAGAVVLASETTKHDTWRVEIELSTGGSPLAVSNDVVVINSDPGAPTLRIDPEPPAIGQPLQCVLVSGGSDPDGDTLSYIASWTHDDVAYDTPQTTTITGDTVPGVDVLPGQAWTCTMTASDGDGGTAIAMAGPVNTPTCVTGGSVTYNANGTGRTGSIQTFTVPTGVCSITIDAYGAQGGSTDGGRGARMRGTFAVSGGQSLRIVVGQQPIQNTALCDSGGGGGGSFVWDNASSSTPMIVAGGGGGGNTNWSDTTCRRGFDAGVGQNGGQGNGATSAQGGTGGNGGFGNAPSGTGSGGAGWLTKGQDSTYTVGAKGGETKFSFLGGSGPTTTFNPGGDGGYGGGGSAVCGCGGGGGYSGGGAGEGSSCRAGGGGGGSFNAGTNQLNQAGARTGNGTVIISW